MTPLQEAILMNLPFGEPDAIWAITDDLTLPRSRELVPEPATKADIEASLASLVDAGLAVRSDGGWKRVVERAAIETQRALF